MAVYLATTDNPTFLGGAVAAAAGFAGGPVISTAARLGRTGLTLAAGTGRATTMIRGVPTSVPIAPAAGEIGAVAGAMTGGAAVGTATQVASNVAEAATSGQLDDLKHPLAGADVAALAGAAAGPLEAAGASGEAASTPRLPGMALRVGEAAGAIEAEVTQAATSAADESSVRGLGGECPDRSRCGR